MVGFLYVPFFFVCSHMGYILVSWLTEPTKTTSAFFLAITIIFILYISFRTIYQIFKTYVGPFSTHAEMSVRFLDKACSPILCGCPCRNWKNEDCDKLSNLDMTGNPAIANLFSHNDAYSDHANPVKAYIPKSTEFENPLDSTGRILGKIAHRVRHIGL